MDEPKAPLTQFTLAGRMLILAHLLMAIGGTLLYITESLPILGRIVPFGRFPVYMFIGPVALVCLVSFILWAWILRRLGIRLVKA